MTPESTRNHLHRIAKSHSIGHFTLHSLFYQFIIPVFLLLPVLAMAQVQTPARIENTENPNARKLSWNSSISRSYFLQQSPNLATWSYLPKVLKGRGAQDTLNITSTAPKEFYRLIWSDYVVNAPLTADHDGDGIPSYAELTVTKTDPLKTSTDGKSDRPKFPNPSNGVHVDPATGIQYVVVPNPPGTSGSPKIVASRYFDTPDYGIEYKKGELALQKRGYTEFTSPTTPANSSVRYLKRQRQISLIDRNTGNFIPPPWDYGYTWTQSLPIHKVVTYNSNDWDRYEIDPVTGTETSTMGTGGTGRLSTKINKPDDYVWQQKFPAWRWYWITVSSYSLSYYDVPPFGNWDGTGHPYYEEYFFEENTFARMLTTAQANRPAYAKNWTEGNPWARWDHWTNELGLTYTRAKFRIKNKNGVTNGEPARIFVYFTPENGGAKEQVMSVQWDGNGTYSPEYEIDPATLKPGAEGTYSINGGSMFFELDASQEASRRSGGQVIIPLGKNTFAGSGSSSLAKSEATAGALTPLAGFPGMDDEWFEGATVTLTRAATTGAADFYVIHPVTGARVPVPYGTNLAADFFHSQGRYAGARWEIEGVTAGPVSVTLTYQKNTTTLSLERSGLVFPLRLASRDRFFAGKLEIPSGWDDLGITVRNPATGETFGTYANLLGGGTTKIYNHPADILADADTNTGGGPKVWFFRNPATPRQLDFYACGNGYGDIEISMTHAGTTVGSFRHTLTPASDFATIIAYVDDWISGRAFQTGGTTPVSIGTPPALNPLVGPCVAPFFYILGQVENLTPVIFGICDGIVAGLKDDIALLSLLGQATLYTRVWIHGQKSAELARWMNDPVQRAKDLKQLLEQLCQDFVLGPASRIPSTPTDWWNFAQKAYVSWEFIQQQALVMTYVIAKNAWGAIVDGLCAWSDDFAGRMMEGAEKAHWQNLPWIKDRFTAPNVSPGDLQVACYTFGYTFGYLGEQAAVAILSAGTLKISQAFKSGVVHAGEIVGLRRLPIIFRSHLVKRWAGELTMKAETKVLVENSLSRIVRTPLSPADKRSALEVLEEVFARIGYDRARTGARQLLDEMLKHPRLTELLKIPGFEERFLHITAVLGDQLGDKLTAKALANWPKLAETLCPLGQSNRIDDITRFDKLFTALKIDTPKSKQAMNDLLESLDGKTAQQVREKCWLPASVGEIYPTLYRYSNWIPDEINGVRKLGVHPFEGWYVTPQKIDKPQDAIDLLQLLIDNPRPRYRLEFEYSSVQKNLRIPRGSQDKKEWLEIITEDYIGDPFFGQPGGATQFLVDDSEIILKSITDMDTGMKIWPLN